MRELTNVETEVVSGGEADAAYAAGIAAAVGFLGIGLALAAGPLTLGAAVFYGASILSSGSSIYRAWD